MEIGDGKKLPVFYTVLSLLNHYDTTCSVRKATLIRLKIEKQNYSLTVRAEGGRRARQPEAHE